MAGMKTLIVSPIYGPSSKTKWLRPLHWLNAFLVEQGHSVTVLTFGNSVDDDNAKRLDGVDIIPFSPSKEKSNAPGMIFAPSEFKDALTNLIPNIDVAMLTALESSLSVFAHRRFVQHHLPYAIFGPICAMFGDSQKHRPIIQRLYDSLWAKPIVRDAAMAFVCNEWDKRSYSEARFDESRVTIVPPPFFPSDAPDPAPLPKDNVYQIAEDDKVIVSIGDIKPEIFTPVMIDVFKDLMEKSPKYRWVVVGEDRGHLKKLVAAVCSANLNARFTFTGPLSEWERHQILQRATCFFLAPDQPLREPTPALDALSRGVPVVVSKQIELPQLNEAGAGISVELDRNALLDAIVTVSSDNSTKRSEKCRAYVSDHFSIQKIGPVFNDSLHKLLKT